MAARENQGLQIALIVFVMFTIILSVTTFIFVGNARHHREAAESNDKKRVEAEENLRKLLEERNNLATKLGLPETASKEEVDKKIGDDVQKYAEFFKLQLPADQQNYSKLVEELAKTVDAKNKELLAQSGENEKLRKELDDAKAKFDLAMKEYNADKQKALQAEKDNQAAYTKQIAEWASTAKQAQSQVVDKDRALQTLRAQAQTEVKKLTDELKRAQETIQSKQGLIEGLTQAAPTVPDGRVSWVNQRDNTVFINVGSEDGLQRRISFSVYDRNATDAATAVKKGSIEVLNIRGPHLAEARIMESTNSDPIVPGDIIYTPIWHPGQTQHFAIAGFIDFDKDGLSDRDKLRDLIVHNGGIVDAEMDEKGAVAGKMSYQTQYLILGEAPSEKALKPVLDAFAALNRESSVYGVPTIKLDAFLAQVGYSVRPAAAAALNTSGPRNLRAPADTPDRTKTSGQGFRERRPPASNGNGAN